MITLQSSCDGTKLQGQKHTQKKTVQLLSDVVMEQSEALLLANKNKTSSSSSSSSLSDDSSSTSSSSSSIASRSNNNSKGRAKTTAVAVDTPSTAGRARSNNSNNNSNLWLIHGRSYDLEDFVKRHPGGVEAILLGRGRDCTALVESYHPFSRQTVSKVLEKYQVHDVASDDGADQTTTAAEKDKDMNNPHHLTQKQDQRHNEENDFFYDILKHRVENKLKEVGIDPIHDRGASGSRTAYYVLIATLWLYTGYMHLTGSTVGSFLFAITGWLMGALGHDAGHFAASRHAWVNEYGVWAMSFICNPILWQHQHTYGHHSYTNEFDHDPDLHHFHLLLRVHKKIRYESQFKYQSNWLYVMFAYLFVVFGTCFYIPWGVISTGTLYGLVDWTDQDRPSKNIGMRLHMALYVFIVMIVPLFTHETLWSASLAIGLHIATLGVVFALFSQINHLNEPSLEYDMDTRQQGGNDEHRRDPRLANSWAAAQIETSNNFASQSTFWHVLSNGLNHQIEHHLFPGLNHGHLHHIAPVVEATCKEYNVEYKSYDTWRDLMDATLSWLDKMSSSAAC